MLSCRHQFGSTMRVVALVSGGKDSCHNMIQCVHAGHNIVALANLHPPAQANDEMDSYMYQTVGHATISLYAEAMELPLYRATIQGSAQASQKDYSPTDGDEVEDLHRLLSRIKEDLDFEAVSVGAILSDYQRIRVENVCARLGVTALAFLWRRDQRELLQEMVACEVHAVVIKVAALGLSPDKHLGKTLAEMRPIMATLSEKYGLNECGEGGEYETFTLDCPLFKKKIVIDEQEMVMHSKDAFAPVAYLNFNKAHLEDKGLGDASQAERIQNLLLPHPPPCEIEPPVGSELNDSLENLSLDGSEVELLAPIVVETGGHVWIGQIDGREKDGKSAMLTALDQLLDILSEHQLAASDLSTVSLYVRRMSHYAALNADYISRLHAARPARLCVQTALPPGVAVRLDAAALRRGAALRRAMHVRSVSHWAPANIGPYSQTVQCGELLHVAGMVGLDPGSMRLVSGGEAQARLALRHVERCLPAANTSANNGWVLQTVCYVTERPLAGHCLDLASYLLPGSLVCCVEVPALPRGASVEWHVWAHAANAQFDSESRRSSLTLGDTSLDIGLRWSSRHRVAAATVLCTWQGASSGDQLSGCVRATISCLRARAGGSAAACQLRLFHRPEDASAVSAAVATLREAPPTGGAAAAVTAVPVRSVGDGAKYQLALVGTAMNAQRPKKD